MFVNAKQASQTAGLYVETYKLGLNACEIFAMEVKFNKDALIKAMKEISYVSNQSGPVEPSKAKVIKMLTDKVMKPVSKSQDSEDWDKREYKMNGDLSYGKNLITTKTLYKKVVTEAVSNTEYRGCRLNLQSIDMKETHCKFIIDRRGHEVLVEMYFPNKNKNITVKLESDNHLSNLYEVSLDSEQFQNNFGFTILKTCDELLESGSKYDLGSDLDTMQYTNGMGTDVIDVNDSMLQQSNLLRESVDGDLAKLRNLCEAVNLMEAEAEEGQDPNAAMFNMGGGDPATPADPPAMTGDQMAQIGAGDVNGDDSNPNKEVMFEDWLQSPEGLGGTESNNASGDSPTGEPSELDNLAKIVSMQMAKDGEVDDNNRVALTGDDFYAGFGGLKNKSAGEIWNLFLHYNNALTEKPVQLNHIGQFREFLRDPGMDELSLEKVERKLHEIFPEAYGEEGTSTLSTTNTDLPGHPNGPESANSVEQNPLAMDGIFGSGGGDVASIGGDAYGSSFMNDGSTASMMDNVNPNAFGSDETDGFIDELNSPDNESGDFKFGGTAVSDEENIANSLGNI